jgi:hypothetical protein
VKVEQVETRVSGRKKDKVKKPIEVDGLGILVGTMKDHFNEDINAFIK